MTPQSLNNQFLYNVLTFDSFQCIENVALYLDVLTISLFQFRVEENAFEINRMHDLSRLFSVPLVFFVYLNMQSENETARYLIHFILLNCSMICHLFTRTVEYEPKPIFAPTL